MNLGVSVSLSVGLWEGSTQSPYTVFPVYIVRASPVHTKEAEHKLS